MNYRPAISIANILRRHRLAVLMSVNHHSRSSLSLMLFQILFLELIAFSHALLQDNGRPFSLCRLIKAKHVSFTHKVRQLIIISFFVSSLLKQLSMLLYSSRYAEGMQGSTARYVTPSIVLCRQKTTTLLLLPTLSKVKLTRLVIKESL